MVFMAACQSPSGDPSFQPHIPVVQTKFDPSAKEIPSRTEVPLDRTAITTRLKAKIARKEPLIAHVFVPLCDNDHQGIVPVNASLGNGQNLKTNLYWGAGYGIRTHFQRQAEWKTLSVTDPAEAHILERVVLKKSYPNGAKVILVADAYDGAFMKRCLEDYLDALGGVKTGKLIAAQDTFSAWADADFLAFNGHDGLMDEEVPARKLVPHTPKDAVVIACFSHSYFEPYLKQAAAYPYVTTTHLLAPEAYVMRAIVDTWATLGTGAAGRTSAATAYNTYQKCGINGATRLFRTGW
jgi:hypothetical protein